ncbi:MAG TPA: FHA domain-containing protein [Roseiflexaceae bacterium]|nr:FHA domain-containing protein [Roseiflexaceae bacterium]
MATRVALEQEMASQRGEIARLEAEVKAVRGYIASNEHVLDGQPESLRAITQDGLARARANLARQEAELHIAQQALAGTQRVLAKLIEVERKQAEVRKYEQDLDNLMALLEKARGDLANLENEMLTLTGPVAIPSYQLVFADGQALALPTDRSEFVVGCTDQADRIFPDVDLTPYGGKTGGVSRRHALIRFLNGSWTIMDLGSSNGTFINEMPVAANVPLALQDRARLRFGAIAASFISSSPGKTVRL